MASPQFTPAQTEFWQTRYEAENTPWDLGREAPPFETLLQKEAKILQPSTMAVFGSGNGHDAAFFARAGFQVTGFDYAPSAVANAKAHYGNLANFQQADIFNLPGEYRGHFDYVLEHTCFCAIPVDRRQDYVRSAAGALKPGGRFIGLFWAHNDTDGPPYKTDKTEITALFSPYFTVDRMIDADNSVSSRKGQEFLGIFTCLPSA